MEQKNEFLQVISTTTAVILVLTPIIAWLLFFKSRVVYTVSDVDQKGGNDGKVGQLITIKNEGFLPRTVVSGHHITIDFNKPIDHVLSPSNSNLKISIENESDDGIGQLVISGTRLAALSSNSIWVAFNDEDPVITRATYSNNELPPQSSTNLIVLVVLVSVSLLYSISLRTSFFIVAAKQMRVYNNWLENNRSKINTILNELRESDGKKYSEVMTLLSEGKTVDLFRVNPELSNQLNPPHLPNSIRTLKFVKRVIIASVFLDGLIIILLVL